MGDSEIINPQTIWLEPWCDDCRKNASEDGRSWCDNDAWGECDHCGRKSVKYVIADTGGDK